MISTPEESLATLLKFNVGLPQINWVSVCSFRPAATKCSFPKFVWLCCIIVCVLLLSCILKCML